MAHAAVLRRILAGTIFGLSLLSTIPSLHAQRLIYIDRNSMKIDKAVPGEISILTVTGAGFRKVTYVEVAVDGVEAAIADTSIVSDSELRIAIRFPRTGRASHRHTYSVRVSGEGRAENLPPSPIASLSTVTPATLDTVAVAPGPPSIPAITFLLDGDPIPRDSLTHVHFEASDADSLATRNLTLRNTGAAPLVLSNLQQPPGFEVLGFPPRIPADSSATLKLRWLPRTHSDPNGTLGFSTNLPNRRLFLLQLTGTIRQPTAPVAAVSPISRGLKTVFLILAAVIGLAAGMLVIRQVRAKKSLHIKSEKDLGRQQISSGKSIRIRFELGLIPRADWGQSTIQVKGRLFEESAGG